MSKRREFPDRIKAQIIKRAMNERGMPVCEGCGAVLKLKAYEIDHVIPEALVVDKTKDLTPTDGQLLGYCCHRGEDGKTNADVKRITKAKWQERKHVLPKKPSGFPKPPPGYKYSWKTRRLEKTA